MLYSLYVSSTVCNFLCLIASGKLELEVKVKEVGHGKDGKCSAIEFYAKRLLADCIPELVEKASLSYLGPIMQMEYAT